jgi:U3 small nucleolar RNA-associated protein 7
MKGKNRPSKRHRKKQIKIIEEKKPEVIKRQTEEVRYLTHLDELELIV